MKPNKAMKTNRTLLGLFGAAVLLADCSDSADDQGTKPSPEKPKDEYVAPEPPETVNTDNLLRVTCFSTLDDETLFASQQPASLATLINNASPASAIYLFERSDFRLGEPIPQVEIARATRCYSFFVQIEPTSSQIKGTGIVTRHLVEALDAVWEGSLRTSGCTFEAPLSQPTPVTLYTSRFEDRAAFEALVAQRGSLLQTSGIVVGSIRNEVKADVEEWLRWNLRNYRIAFAGSASTPCDLFVLTPVGFVCRSIEKRSEASLPYYLLTIEKL